jgi:uncharacterized protein
MRLGILSDTHDELDRTNRAVRILRNAGAEALVHCGDLLSAPIVQAISALPAWFVFGNNDADSVPALRAAADEFRVVCLGWSGVIELEAQPIGVVHGHLTSDVRRVLASRPTFLLSGHSHMRADVMVDSIRHINPGALHRADAFTVAILELSSGTLRFLRIDD